MTDLLKSVSEITAENEANSIKLKAQMSLQQQAIVYAAPAEVTSWEERAVHVPLAYGCSQQNHLS